jgi:hypothetical protein
MNVRKTLVLMINQKINKVHVPSERDNEDGNKAAFSVSTTHEPLYEMQCSQVKDATPSSPQTNVPSPMIPAA